MYHNRFTIQIDLLKYKRFKDGGCAYKNTGSSHLNKYTVSIRLNAADGSKTTNKRRTPSEECSIYSRIIRKNSVQLN